jgi:hypothetical protein
MKINYQKRIPVELSPEEIEVILKLLSQRHDTLPIIESTVAYQLEERLVGVQKELA